MARQAATTGPSRGPVRVVGDGGGPALPLPGSRRRPSLPMPSKLPSFLFTLLLGLAAAVLPAHAGEAPGTDSAAFPLPVLAPVMVPEDVPASLAVTSYGITPDGDAVE